MSIHHTERHKIGIIDFARKYKIKPIKLDKELVMKLKLTNKSAMEDKNER